MDTSSGTLYYEMAGQGETVVLAHAGFVDCRMWDEQWQTFTQHYRVIRYDMQGFGLSDPATGPVSRRDELYGLLRSLNVERAHLIGCSMGGSAALDLTLAHPELVASLTLVSSVPGGFEYRGEPPGQLMEMIEAIQRGDKSRASELQLRLWMDGPFRKPEQVDPDIRRRTAVMNRIPVDNETWLRADSRPVDPLDPPAAMRLAEIHVPVLVMAGALDDPEVVRAADYIATSIPGTSKVIIPDAAHVPNMEKPEEFNRTVMEFLASLCDR